MTNASILGISCVGLSPTFPAVAAAKSLQSCPTLCGPIDGSPPGSPVPGILKARTLEWVAICFSKAWKWKVKVKSLSNVRLLVTPWTAAYQAPPSLGFSRQEYWSGVPWPSLNICLSIPYLVFSFSFFSLYIGSSFITSLELTQMHSLFGWVKFHSACVPQLLYQFICLWTSILLPCPSYCK